MTVPLSSLDLFMYSFEPANGLSCLFLIEIDVDIQFAPRRHRFWPILTRAWPPLKPVILHCLRYSSLLISSNHDTKVIWLD